MVFNNLDALKKLYSQKSLYQSLLMLSGLMIFFILMFVYNTSHPYIWSSFVGSIILSFMIGLVYLHISGLNAIKRMEELNILASEIFPTMDRRAFINLAVDNTK